MTHTTHGGRGLSLWALSRFATVEGGREGGSANSSLVHIQHRPGVKGHRGRRREKGTTQQFISVIVTHLSYRVQARAKEILLFAFPSFILPTKLMQPKHFQPAPIELPSLNLSPFLLLDPVWLDVLVRVKCHMIHALLCHQVHTQ